MKTRIIPFQLITPILILFILPYIYSQSPAPQDLYSKVSPAMMLLNTYDSDSLLYSSGTAVAVGDSGIVFTNMHIFKDAIWMELVSGSAIIRDIKIVGFEPDKDILVLKIPAGIIRGIKIANSDSVKIGELVYAIGNPLGFKNTFSNGILSGIRNNEKKQLQFTASISPGSSGGALLNSKGEIIGITSLTYKNGQNINFAVPINYYSNTEIIDANDSAKVNLFKDIVEIYNSGSGLASGAENERLAQFCADSINNRNALYTVAKIYCNREMIDKTLEVCSNAIEKYPLDKQFRLLRGEEYVLKSEGDSALSDFNKALEIDSLYEDALLNRGFYFSRRVDKYKSALDDYFKLVSINSNNDFIYLDIAEIYQVQHDTANAIANLKKSYAYDGFTAAMFYERGRDFSDLKMYDEALADFTSAISLNTENADYYFSRAVAYSKQDLHENAMSDYFSVLKFNPMNMLALNNLAYEYFNLEDYSKAEETFLKALSIDDKHFDSYIGLAITAHTLNKKNECARNMYKAMKLSPFLENGMAGLDSLKKHGNFWSNTELKNIREVFVMMGVEDSDKFAMFDDDLAVESVERPNKMATRVK